MIADSGLNTGIADNESNECDKDNNWHTMADNAIIGFYFTAFDWQRA